MFTAQTLRKIAAASAILVFACGGFVVVNAIANFPGGSRSMSNVVDYDRRLVAHAQDAEVLIDGILAYIDSQGAPPIDQDELCKALPASKISADASNVDGWRYERLGTGFTLRKKLGWDPSLTYHFDGTSDRWIYDPGDGGQASTIQLLQSRE